MHVFLTGATGVLGRRLVPLLVARGHTVTGLVRRPEQGQQLARLGAAAAHASLFDAAALAKAAEGAAAVIHGATAIPVAARPSPADWAMNDRIRTEGTRALADAAGRVGAGLFVVQSVVWVARPEDDGPFDELSPPTTAPLYRSAFEAEGVAREAGSRAGMKVAVVRCGAFYASDAGHTRMLAGAIARRRMPIVGAGDAPWANLHAEDAAAAFTAAVEADRAGLWHAVDDTPLTVRDMFVALADALGAPPPRRVPAWLARLLAGRGTVAYLTRGTRTSNARLRAELGWRPRYPSWHDGLPGLIEAWRRERLFGLA